MNIGRVILLLTLWICGATTAWSQAAEVRNESAHGDFLLRLLVGPHGGPIYSVTLFTDGTAEYEGVEKVKSIGKTRYSLPPGVMFKVNQALKEANFIQMKDEYGFRKLHNRGVQTITGKLNGVEKTVSFGTQTYHLLVLFRNLKQLMETEKFRCPFFQDYGVAYGGVRDECEAQEAREAELLDLLK